MPVNGVERSNHYVFRSADVPKLDLDNMKAVEVEDWSEKWRGYMNLSGLRNEQNETKMDVLKQGLSSSTLRKLKTLKPNCNDVDEAVKVLVRYAEGKKSLIMERKKLFERRQKQGESIVDYALAISELLEASSFGTSEHESIRDAIKTAVFVVGLRDDHTMEAALALKDPKFAEVFELATAREVAVHDRQRVKKQDGDGEATVAKTSVDKKNKKNQFTASSSSCVWCGKKTRHTREECPASGATCRSCNKRGHFAKVCRSTADRSTADRGRANDNKFGRAAAANQLSLQAQQLSWIQQQQAYLNQQQEALLQDTGNEDWSEEAELAQVFSVSVDQADKEEDGADVHHEGFQPHIFAIDTDATDHEEVAVPHTGGGKDEYEKAPRIELEVEFKNKRTKVRALPDTGADVSAAGIDFLARIGASSNDLRPSDLKPRSANGQKMIVYGKVQVQWNWQDNSKVDEVYIIEGTSTILLSWSTVKAIGLLSQQYPGVNRFEMEKSSSTVNALEGEEEDNTAEGKLARRLRQELIDRFPQVFSDQIKVMKGEVFKISLVDDAKPYAVRAARPVPLPLRDPLYKELQTLQAKGIIEPVTEPTEWCSPIVVEEKPRGGVRVCVDLTRLNGYVKREWYASDPPNIAVATIPADSEFFATLDATKGYHQCPLDDESRNLTTFLTPFGRFRYCRAPFGICSISEHYNRRMDEALGKIEDHRRTVDDILMHSPTLRKLFHQVERLLQRCQERSITLSADKFVFGKRRVKFAGFIITKGHYELDDAITKAISEFPTPSSRTKLRSFIGLVNQLAFSVESIAKLLTPLRPLLSTKNAFQWHADHQEAFEQVRRKLSQAPQVAYYNLHGQLRITTDASGEGLGFILEQEQADGQWKMVQAGSRMLSDAETRYAAIELEMLGVCFATRRAEMFIKGVVKPVQLRTDHKPLVTIINSKGLHELQNPRIIRMKQFLMPYVLLAQHVPGRENAVADALSRAPVDAPVKTSVAEIKISMLRDEQGSYLTNHQQMRRLRELIKVSLRDEQYCKLRHLLTTGGFPAARTQLDPELRAFWQVKEHLSIHEDAIFMGTRALIPRQMRPEILRRLHSSHQGIQRTQERARLVVYWPNIDQHIQEVIEECPKCQLHRPQNAQQPMRQHERPDRAGQAWAADLFEVNGVDFMVMTDIYSTWPEVIRLHQKNSKAVKVAMDKVWTRFGIPQTLVSDGGPQFTSHEMQSFLKEKCIRHVRSAPTYPQSNAFAEAAVKTMKRMIQKNWSFNQGLNEMTFLEGLRQYRNTPSTRDGLSPAAKMLGRQINDELQFRVEKDFDRLVAKDTKKYDARAKQAYDKKARELRPIEKGQPVAVWCQRSKKFAIFGIVTDAHDRRYWVKTPKGTIVRDRRHLIRAKPVDQEKEDIQEQAGRPQTGQQQTSSWWTLTNCQNNGPSQSEMLKRNGRSEGAGTQPASTYRGWLNQQHRFTDWAQAARERMTKEGEGRQQQLQRHPLGQRGIPTLLRPARLTNHASSSGNVTEETNNQKSSRSTIPTRERTREDPMANRENEEKRMQQTINMPTLPFSATQPPNVDPAARIMRQTPPSSQFRDPATKHAPKKRIPREQMRQESRRRERDGRWEHQQARRPVARKKINFNEREDGTLETITEALKTAFQTVRRSARQVKPPERWADQM